MQLWKNRKFAAGVLAVCVVTSIFGFGGGKLSSDRSHAARVFDEGIDTSFAVRFSMDAYLDNCAEYARTMMEEYRLNVGDDDLSREIASLADGCIGGSIDDRHAAYSQLTSRIETLYTDYHRTMPKDSASAFDRAYHNFVGETSMIGYDEYHALAENFNRERSAFPAKLVSKLWGIGDLNTFQ